jgi:glucose uptake protein
LKLAGSRWRFELFYIDFAIGVLLLSLIAAFTLGSLGSELAFTDRMLVAGRGAQAFVVAAGFIFNLGNMLLVGAASLIGIAAAFPLSIGLAIVIGSLFNFGPANTVSLASGIAIMIVALLLDGIACRSRDHSSLTTAAPTPKTPAKASLRARTRKTAKGLILAIIGGIILGFFYPVAARGLNGDFGVGPYAGLLLFSLGLLVSTVIFNFYFLNIAIEGGPLTLGAYTRGHARQHFWGLAGGALWAVGALAAALARSVGPQIALNPVPGVLLPLASVLLVMFCGALAWKEFGGAPANSKVCFVVMACLFGCALFLAALPPGR